MLKPNELKMRLVKLLELEKQRMEESRRAVKKMLKYLVEVSSDLRTRKGDAALEGFLKDRPEFVEVVNNIQEFHKKQLEAEAAKNSDDDKAADDDVEAADKAESAEQSKPAVEDVPSKADEPQKALEAPEEEKDED